MKLFKWSILIAIVVFLLYPRKQPFGEFEINDVSQSHVFIDSVATEPPMVHVEITVWGRLDSAASLALHSYPDSGFVDRFELNKGEIKLHKYRDFYNNKLWIIYQSKGAKKGKLHIKTQIR